MLQVEILTVVDNVTLTDALYPLASIPQVSCVKLAPEVHSRASMV